MSNSNIFLAKYLKYKNKYLLLKKQLGGTVEKRKKPEPESETDEEEYDLSFNLPENHDEIVQIPAAALPLQIPEASVCIIPIQVQPQPYDLTTLCAESTRIVTIDGIEFKLVCIIDSPCCNNDRKQYLVYNSTNDIKLIFYRSISELDFLRLAYRHDCNVFNKGQYDYVQQTFAHIDLQRFIYSEELREALLSIRISRSDYDMIVTQQSLLDHINDTTRKIDTLEPFNYLSGERAASNYFKQPKLQAEIKGTSGCGKSRSNIKDELLEFSGKMEEKYNVDSVESLYEYNVADKFNVTIYQIVLSEKTNNANKLKLYCIKYNLSNFEGTVIESPIVNKLAPLFLTTNDSTITPYGVYSHYIISGYYICKVFDYRAGCMYFELKNCIKAGLYTFIGDRYDGLFPLGSIPL